MRGALLFAALLLSGCASVVPNAANKYDPADLEAAIAIADAHGDAGPAACYRAIKAQLAIAVVGPLSAYESARVSLPLVKLACVPISLP